MQAIFFAHGPFATRVKAKAKLTTRQDPRDSHDVPVWHPGDTPGWESTSPAIMKRECVPATTTELTPQRSPTSSCSASSCASNN